ncbi:Thiamine metabolism regulatory protein THI3 [Nakaseomyces bracarensis]|uniref:Thiamine metabolism regulatory protein THI3 n=1 Tax=Nakaseomyces bracarensis TaxID=273131 RepID=A0ABR4NV81_9SACH
MSYTEIHGVPSQIPISEYLFHRLNQLKIWTVFGLPGDFSMPLLDKLYTIPTLRWAGNTNELNAAYAADGYARLKGIGCLITTFGVGELSAINGIAGSYAEHVGLLHIVGMPPTSAQTKQLLLHHTLGNGDYSVFYRIANDIACYAAIINDTDLSVDEVDKCIRKAWIHQKPVYLGVPVNQVNIPVDSNRLNTPINLRIPRNSREMEQPVVDLILDQIYKAKNPVIIVDACVSRQHALKETALLCDMTRFPVFVTPMGKGTIDESNAQFKGVFTGSLSSPEVREVVYFSDFVLFVGALLPEFNTSTFNFGFKTKNCAILFSTAAKFKKAIFPDLHLKPTLQALIKKLEPSRIQYKYEETRNIVAPRLEPNDADLLRQEWVWNEISHWFHERDTIITETGSSAFGINQTRFPTATIGINQALWGSVGFALGACLGASFAVEEMTAVENQVTTDLRSYDRHIDVSRRTILFVGDGAFQLTAQELSTIIRWKLKPYIFIMNNQGYSVDRYLHHRSDASYYDVQPWQYLQFLKLFGATSFETRKIVTVGDFKEMLADETFAIPDKIRMIEIMLPQSDVPETLVARWQAEKESTNKRMHDSSDDSSTNSSPSIDLRFTKRPFLGSTNQSSHVSTEYSQVGVHYL